jgi:tRNA-2-methylthio-N6-dimethylallyladenosine synthase
MVGSMQRVLVTGTAVKNNTDLAARTANNRVVNFAGPRDLVDRYVDVRITAALPHSLRGELHDNDTRAAHSRNACQPCAGS